MKHGCLCCSESCFLFQITERPCRKGGNCLPPANPGFEDLASFPRGVLLAAGGRPGAVTHACGLFLGTSRIQGRGLRAGGSPVRRCRGDLPCPRPAGWCRRAASVAMHVCGGRHGERGRLSSLDGAADALPSPHRRICAAPATLLAGAPSGSPVFPPPRGLRVAWAWPPSALGGTGVTRWAEGFARWVSSPPASPGPPGVRLSAFCFSLCFAVPLRVGGFLQCWGGPASDGHTSEPGPQPVALPRPPKCLQIAACV